MTERPQRILVVDDSPTARLLIRAILESDPALSVVAEARNGEEAVRFCAKFSPDLVTMDIQMPGMDGYQAITHIMSQTPCPIVVLTTMSPSPLVAVSMKALALGALTALAKPYGMPGTDADARQLVAQVRLLAGLKVVRRTAPGLGRLSAPGPATGLDAACRGGNPLPEHHQPGVRTPHPVRPRLAAIGVSTGGPPALEIILRSLPADFPLPLVVVQHISRGFVEGMVAWLSSATGRRCKVAEHGEIMQPGVVYFAPSDVHLVVRASGVLALDAGQANGVHRPSINVLFESVAASFGPAALGVLLTGMGADGAKGLLAMRRAGAYTLAQDEGSSVVFGMPKAAIDLGAAVEIVGLEQLSGRLSVLARTGRPEAPHGSEVDHG